MAKKRGKLVKKSSTTVPKKVVSTSANPRKHLGMVVLSYFGGVLAGNYLGKWSGLGGAGFIGVGIWKKNPYLTSLGAGALFSAGQNVVKENLSGNEDEMEGFSLKKFVSDGNERAKNYFQVLGQKFMLAKAASTSQDSASTTNGLSGEDNQPYFIPQSVDYMSKLDAQIRQLNGTNGMGESPDSGDIELDSNRNY